MSFLSLLYITRKSLEQQRSNTYSNITNTRTPTLEHRYRDKLSEEVNDKIEHFRKTNDDASRTYCNTLSKTMLMTLKENLSCEKAVVEVMNAYRDFLVYALDVYEDLSLGPSRWEVWSRFTSTDCVVPLLEKMSSVSESISLDKIASENKNSALQSEIESAKQKAIDTNAAFDQERKSFEKEVERLTSEFESEKGRLKSLLESKSSELERTLKNTERDAEEKKQLKEKIETMRDEHRAQLQKKEDEKSKLTRKYDARISDLNREIVDTVKKSNEEKMKQQEEKIKMESKLTNLENDFKRLKDDHQREIEKKEESHRVMMDRKEREIKEEASKRARDEVDGEQMLKVKQELKEAKEHQKLMKEHLDVTKDLLNAKNSQVVEIEYQWAAAKAKLAQAQLDREELDADVCVLEDLVTKLKLKAVKTAQDLKSLRLTKKQTTRFYSL